jgi:hypothetical protein
MKIVYREKKGLKKGEVRRNLVRIDKCCMDLIELSSRIKVNLEVLKVVVEDGVNNPDATLECPYCLTSTKFEKRG